MLLDSVSAVSDEHYDLPVPGTARGQRTRQRLLSAAEDVFGSMGYDRASITAITQAAGVAQGTFYVYFPSKHAVFVELIKDFAARVRAVVAAATTPVAEAGGSRVAVERAGLEAWLRFCADHRGLYRVMREASIIAPETHRWYYESWAQAYAQNFARLGGDGVTADVDTLAYVMIAIGDWLGLKWLIWEGKRPPKAVLDHVTALLDHGLMGALGTNAAARVAGRARARR
jgi:AcrR family transcriptional regulator